MDAGIRCTAAGLDDRGYNQLKSWVHEHQRPTTEAENEEMVREKLAELRGEG